MTGLRMPVARIKKRLAKVSATTQADAFRPELMEFVGKALATALENTPVRDEGLIESNQLHQYDLRINYIPSVHDTRADPRLVVKPQGVFFFSGGKWYRPDVHKLPDAVWGDYIALNEERERRIASISRRRFVDGRKQARFLYQKSWWQVAASLRLAFQVASQIVASTTRRKPKQMPPKAYAQIRGGKETLSVVVFNPFLEEESRYKPFSGRAILAQAIARHRPDFIRKVENKVRRMIYHARKNA